MCLPNAREELLNLIDKARYVHRSITSASDLVNETMYVCNIYKPDHYFLLLRYKMVCIYFGARYV